jgi:hypothetical protein
LKVGQICQTERTGDNPHVKLNVVLQRLIQNLQEITAELFAAGATQSFPAPDSAERMITPVSILDQHSEDAAQRFRIAERLFDARRFGLAQSVFQIATQLFARDFVHEVEFSRTGRLV